MNLMIKHLLVECLSSIGFIGLKGKLVFGSATLRTKSYTAPNICVPLANKSCIEQQLT